MVCTVEIIHLDKLMNQQSIPLYMTPNPPQQYMHISPFAAELLDQIRLIGKKVNTENDNTICVEFYPVGTVCTPPPPTLPSKSPTPYCPLWVHPRVVHVCICIWMCRGCAVQQAEDVKSSLYVGLCKVGWREGRAWAGCWCRCEWFPQGSQSHWREVKEGEDEGWRVWFSSLWTAPSVKERGWSRGAGC